MQSQLYDAGGSLQQQLGQQMMQQNMPNNADSNVNTASGNGFSSTSSSTNSYPEYHQLSNGPGYAVSLASGNESSINTVSTFTPTSFKMQPDPATILSSSSSVGIPPAGTIYSHQHQQSYDGTSNRKSNGLLDSTLAAMNNGSPVSAVTSRAPSAASTASNQSQSQMQRSALNNSSSTSTNGTMHLAASAVANSGHQAGTHQQPGLSNNTTVYANMQTQHAPSGSTNFATITAEGTSEEDNQQSMTTQVALASCEDVSRKVTISENPANASDFLFFYLLR
jgi:hypothetical protein